MFNVNECRVLTDTELHGVVGGAAAAGSMSKLLMTVVITNGVVQLASTVAQARAMKTLTHAVAK